MLKTLNQNIFSLRGVIGIFVLWGLLQSMVRLLSGRVLSGDDAKENIFTQSWDWGYLPDNPPLYEWLLHASQTIFGPTLFSFLFLKYALLTLSGVFVFLTARRVLRDEKWAALSAFGLVLLYQIGWNYFQALSHSALAFTLITALIYAGARLFEHRRLTDYLWFGLALGLGLLAKYNFVGLALSLLVAGLILPEPRKIFLNWRILVSLALAGLLLTPHLFWVADHWQAASAMVSDSLGLAKSSHMARALEGVGSGLIAILSFFLPFLLVALVLFRKGLGRRWSPKGDERLGLVAWLGLAGMIGVALMLFGAVALGVPEISERYAIPFLFPLWFWLMARMRSVANQKTERVYLASLGGFALFILLFRMGTGFIAEPFCKKCMDFVPYDAVIEAAREKIDGPVTLFVMEENTAGNIRRAFPKAQTIWLNLSPIYYPAIEARPCLMIWSEQMAGGPMPPIIRDETNSGNTISVTGKWKHPYKDEWRETEWFITTLDENTRTYKHFCAPR